MAEFDPVTGRITLTKAHIASEDGQRLIQLLLEIGIDGQLTDEELTQLSEWLQNAPQHIPAIRHLLELVTDALIDGVISAEERKILQKQIERVLPSTERERLVMARKAFEEKRCAEERNRAQQEKEERERLRGEERVKREREYERQRQEYNKPTEAQLRYIKGLGGSLHECATKQDASDRIEQLLHSNGSISPRQQMVLRFWNITPEPHWGKAQVSVWMDQFYESDSDHQLAWELFKEESGDTGSSRDPERVPVGIGQKYLLKVRSGAVRASFSEPKKSGGINYFLIFGFALVFILVLIGSCIRK